MSDRVVIVIEYEANPYSERWFADVVTRLRAQVDTPADASTKPVHLYVAIEGHADRVLAVFDDSQDPEKAPSSLVETTADSGGPPEPPPAEQPTQRPESVHEFDEDVNDYSMCTCGIPAAIHEQFMGVRVTDPAQAQQERRARYEGAIASWQNDRAAAVMAVADVEMADLKAEVDEAYLRIAAIRARWASARAEVDRLREERDEARLGGSVFGAALDRVEALADTWDRIAHTAAHAYAKALRAALDPPTDDGSAMWLADTGLTAHDPPKRAPEDPLKASRARLDKAMRGMEATTSEFCSTCGKHRGDPAANMEPT